MQKKKIQGATLIEIILVLVIASSILMLSISQYLSYRRSADVVQLQANVDMLFDALSTYYRANCSNQDSPLSKVSPDSFVVPIDVLMRDGYLVLKNNKMQMNPLVNADNKDQGYILQFNQYQINGQLPSRTQDMSPALGSTTPLPPANVGSVVLWQAQVAVNLENPDTGPQYMSALGANCLSDSTGSSVTPCTPDSTSTAGAYVVFERGPSRPSSKGNSILWPTMPVVKLFKQEYMTDPITILTAPVTQHVDQQYYVCGS